MKKGFAVDAHSDSIMPVYLDRACSLPERIQDLLARMTLEEKISQMQHGATAIPRLNIPAYNFWSEALHGVGRNGRATVFPQAIGMAATWNPVLIERIASAIADEARAKYHETLRRKGDTLIYQGLTFWSPNVNIFRDPRWGRGQETWGEDPFLTGEMGVAFVRGLQGDDPRYLKTAACAKHYAVHSGPERIATPLMRLCRRVISMIPISQHSKSLSPKPRSRRSWLLIIVSMVNRVVPANCCYRIYSAAPGASRAT